MYLKAKFYSEGKAGYLHLELPAQKALMPEESDLTEKIQAFREFPGDGMVEGVEMTLKEFLDLDPGEEK